MVVIGAMRGTFKDRDTGKQISYAKVYVTYPFDKIDGVLPDGCVGQKCEALSVPVECVGNVHVGDDILPIYNRYGRVQDIEIRSKKSA